MIGVEKMVDIKEIFDRNQIKNFIEKFNKKKVLVIGDLMLDRYIFGKVNRISPEAPVPLIKVDKKVEFIGGAGNVLLNLKSLGAEVMFCSVIGKDGFGRFLKEKLQEHCINIEGVVEDERPTTVKTRVIAHSQHVVRVDEEDNIPIKGKVLKEVKNWLTDNISYADAVLISDYGKGVISRALFSFIIECTNKYKKIVALDPKVENASFYKNITFATPNHKEACGMIGKLVKNDYKWLCNVGKKLLKKIRASFLVITRGEKGMLVFDKNVPVSIPAIKKEVYDVTGAGDTVISVMTLASLAGCSPLQGAWLATIAASIVVGAVGSRTVTQKELINEAGKLF